MGSVFFLCVPERYNRSYYVYYVYIIKATYSFIFNNMIDFWGKRRGSYKKEKKEKENAKWGRRKFGNREFLCTRVYVNFSIMKRYIT